MNKMIENPIIPISGTFFLKLLNSLTYTFLISPLKQQKG